MESKVKEFLTKKRLCAILTLIMMIANMFSPYGVLMHKSYAATIAAGEPYYELSIREIVNSDNEEEWTDETYYYYYDYYQGDVETFENYEGTRVIFVDLSIKGASTVNGGDINLVYDSSKLKPAQETYSGTGKKKVYWIEDATTFTNPNDKAENDFATINWGTEGINSLDTTANTIRTGGSVGAADVAAGEYFIADGEVVGTFMFVLQEGVTLEDLTTSTFSLTAGEGLSDGLQIAYFPDGIDGVQYNVTGPDYLVFDGFAAGEKTVTSITLEASMTKTKYYVGEDIDFSGASVKISYDDGTEETITNITAAIADGTISVDSTVAGNTKKVVITAGDKTCEIPYNIATGIIVSSTPANLTYDHNDTLDFTGGTIDVVYDDRTTESLDIKTGISSGKLTVDATKADVNDQTITFTYIDGTSTADLALTVNDPIDSIEITDMPTDVEYDHGESIDLSGGVIKAVKRSGAEITGILMTSSAVSVSASTADINSCSTTWPNGALIAGSQTITVTYAGKTATYPITVNDTISSIAVKTQPTAKNKYGTVAGSLDYTGATIEVTTASGNTFDTSITAGMVDTTSYNASTLNTQNLPVNYGGKTTTSGNGINITLLDYINGITVTAPSNLTAEYNTELDLSSVTYVKNYASGATSSALPVTKDMISGYNKTPASTDFNVIHEYEQQVTVILSTADDSDIDTVPVSDTFTVKTKDKVTGIRVSQKPSTVVYNYGETFSASGGIVELTYASGATNANTISMLDSKISITETDGSAVNTTPASSQFTNGKAIKTLKVTYTENSQSYDTTTTITVLDVLDSIQIDTQPTKVFDHGDTFSVGSGTLKVSYKSGAIETISLDDGTDITETVAGTAVNMSPAASQYDSNNQLTKNITVSYTYRGETKAVAYDITINNSIDSIVIDESPKTNYNLNESTVGVGGTLTVTRKNGATATVNIEDSMVSNLDTTVEVTNKVATITYADSISSATTTYTYNVKDTVTQIVVQNPPTVAKYNEELDLSGTTIEVTKGSGTKTENVTASMISGYDKTTLGDQTITVTYGGQTDTFVVKVKDYVKEIIVSPDSITGMLNEELSTLLTSKNVEYQVVYAKAGAKTPVALADSMVTGYSKTTTSEQSLTVTYRDNDTNSYTYGTDITGSLKVKLNNVVTAVTITPPTQTTYKHGESLNLAGGVINLSYADGTTGTEVISSATVTESDGITVANMSPAATEFVSDNKMSKTLLIKYTSSNGVEGSVNYPITIINDVRSIAMHSTNHKVSYNLNEPLDLTNAEIKITRAVGTADIISVTDSMVSGFASNVEVTSLPLTVSYTENEITKTTSYNIDVKDTVTQIVVQNPPTVAKYNEELDLSGTTIEVTKGSGTKTENVTASMISGYDKTTLGDQTVTVTYGGQTDTFVVKVKDYVKEIIVSPDSITGMLNEELSTLLTSKDVEYQVVYAKAGAKSPVALPGSMITGYDKTKSDEQSLTVTYRDNDTDSYTYGTDITGNLKIKLSNLVTSVVITPPTKTIYEHGDSLDLSNGKITITYADTTTSEIPLEASMVTETLTGNAVNMSPNASEYDALTNDLSKELKIEYTQGGISDSKTYNITIVNSVDSIDIAASPKTSYNLNESTAGVGGMLTVTRKAGNSSTVNIEDSMVSGIDTSVEGTNKTATVTYTETTAIGVNTKTADYTYSVVDQISGISIKNNPNKMTYGYSDTIDLTGGEITVRKQSGSTEDKLFTAAGVTVTETDGSSIDLTNVTFGADHKATKTLKVNYAGKDATFDITVINKITKIEIKQTPKTSYEIGESLDLSKGTIEVTRENGEKEEIALNNSNITVTGFDSTKENTSLTLTVKYTENGETKDTSYTVSVEDIVSDMQITTIPKTAYKYGESLDVSTGEITVVRSSGPVTLPIDPAWVKELDGTEFNSKKLGTRKLKVTYGGFEREYEITVSDYVTGIILTPPTKLTYEYGESLDLTGGIVQKVMASGAATTPVALTDSSVTLSTFNPTQVSAQTIEVTYEGFKESFGVIVEDNIKSIAIKQTPTKVTYKYGEALDVTGGLIEVIRTSGASTDVSITTSMVTGFNPNQLDEQTLTVTYEEKTATYDITVEDYVTDINIKKPTKLVYKLGETIDLSGGEVELTMASGLAKTPVVMTNADVTIQGFDTSSEGAKTIKVTYKGFTKEFGITVVDPLSGVTLKTLPNKTDYLYGESLDLTGATLEVTKESGATQIIPITKDMVTGYNSKELGNQTITVTYEGFTGQFVVNVEDYVSKLKVEKPDKVEYEYGESLDLTGGKVSIIMASGAVKETVEMTASMVTGFNSKKEGTQTISVEYKGLQGNFQVNVEDKVKGISMNTEPDKTTYKYGENLDLTGATITVVKSSGITIIPVTKDMVSDYDANTPGTQVVKVTYKGFTTKFIVFVEEPVEEEEEVAKPEKPVIPPINKSETPITDDIDVEEPVEELPVETNTNNQEKPTITLGVKDEKQDEEEPKDDMDKKIAAGIGILALLILLILIISRKNVKVYVQEDGEFVLGGKDKITKKNPKLNIDEYLDGETYPNKVKIVLNDSISEKLDGKEIEIKHRGNMIKHKVKYQDEPYEIILE